MELSEAVGLSVRRLRLQQGRSQEELAYAAGLDRTYVSGLERGTRNPALSTLERVAIALDVRLSRIFGIAERLKNR